MSCLLRLKLRQDRGGRMLSARTPRAHQLLQPVDHSSGAPRTSSQTAQPAPWNLTVARGVSNAVNGVFITRCPIEKLFKYNLLHGCLHALLQLHGSDVCG